MKSNSKHYHRKPHHRIKIKKTLFNSDEFYFLLFMATLIFGYLTIVSLIQIQYSDKHKLSEIPNGFEAISICSDNNCENNKTTVNKNKIQTNNNASTKKIYSNSSIENASKTAKTSKTKNTKLQNYQDAITISSSEKLLLEKLVYAESNICTDIDQQAVATVVLERSRKRNLTISEVIFSPGQFSTVINGKIYSNNGKTEVTSEMAKTVEEPVEKAIKNGSESVAKALKELAEAKSLDAEEFGGEPLYFYTVEECSQKALKDRENIRVKVKIDKLTFYRKWN